MPVETLIRREDRDVDRRVGGLGLNKKSLLTVVTVAIEASAEASPFHPANAAGTFAYQSGTWALRNEFVGSDWVIDRSNSVEAIKNEDTKVKIVYSNVDLACNEDQGPKPRSRKGAGAERVCNGNLFDELPQYAPNQDDEYATYFLMVDENGAAELTRPVIRDGTFSSCIERIFISLGGDDIESGLLLDDDDAVKDFDPLVLRK